MRLFADVCEMPVVLPASHEGAVVLGAAMLGRFAAEIAARSDRTEMTPKARGETLWKIMVCDFILVRAFICMYEQVEMTPLGTAINPAASLREKRLLEAKYRIFLESITIQRRWREEMDQALTTIC